MLSLNTLINAVVQNFESIFIVQSVLVVVMALMAVAMIVVVLMQKSSSDGLGAISGEKTDTYYGKNKKQNKEKVLKIITISLGVIMVIVSIVFFALNVLTI